MRLREPSVMPAMRDWWERNKPAPRVIAPPPKKTKEPVVYEPVTEEEARAIVALQSVVFPVGMPSKRFAADVQGAKQLSASQRKYLWALVWRHRRQINDQELIRIAKQKQETP